MTKRRACKQSLIDKLPFVGKHSMSRKGQWSRSYWSNVRSTGDYHRDCKVGSQYAYRALQTIKAESFQPLLGWIVLDMIKKKCPTGFVVGFFQTIADVCLGYRKIPDASPEQLVPCPAPRTSADAVLQRIEKARAASGMLGAG